MVNAGLFFFPKPLSSYESLSLKSPFLVFLLSGILACGEEDFLLITGGYTFKVLAAVGYCCVIFLLPVCILLSSSESLLNKPFFCGGLLFFIYILAGSFICGGWIAYFISCFLAAFLPNPKP